jgi:hypothetical protein
LQQEPVLLLKIDTEGFERSVLQGLTALLEANKVGASICAADEFNAGFRTKG